MFALIIAIIAIALTVYLAVSTLFYGGDALSNGSARAIASAFVNQGQQINGAHALYKNDNAGASITALQDLVDDQYLSSIPQPSVGNAWAVTANLDTNGAAADGVVASTIASTSAGATKAIPDEVCEIINFQAGGSEPGAATYVQGDSETFGCFAVDASNNTVWYRL